MQLELIWLRCIKLSSAWFAQVEGGHCWLFVELFSLPMFLVVFIREHFEDICLLLQLKSDGTICLSFLLLFSSMGREDESR